MVNPKVDIRLINAELLTRVTKWQKLPHPEYTEVDGSYGDCIECSEEVFARAKKLVVVLMGVWRELPPYTSFFEGHIVWGRYPCHPRCAKRHARNYAKSVIHRPPRESTAKTEKRIIAKRFHSSQILLMLEELGLPRDVAWVIAGIACWLL